MQGERNFLLGLLAVCQRRLSTKQLAEAVVDADSDADLAGSLFGEVGISEEDKAALESMVDEAVTNHGGDVQATIASLLESESDLAKTFGEAATLASQDDIRTVMSAVSPAPAAPQDGDGATLPTGGGMPQPRDPDATLATGGGAPAPSDPDATLATSGPPPSQRDPDATLVTEGGAAQSAESNRTIGMSPSAQARIEGGGDPFATVVTEGGAGQATIVTDAGATVVTGDNVRRALEAGEELPTIATGAGARPALGGLSAAQLTGEALVPAVHEHTGRYEEVKVFGAGGMGKIYLMHDTHFGRDIALKTLLPDLGGGTHTRFTGAPTVQMLTVPIIARFLQEARVTGQLEHPSIVPVYEIGYRDDASLYYTMKLVRGRDLHKALEECKNIGDRLRLLNHFVDLCQAIAYAHSRGVIHRDLKPMNVMIGEFGETVVIDWGIAKVRGEQDIHERGLRENVKILKVGQTTATAKTMYGQAMGSPYYMPPEQAEGRTDEIDERSDTYALGAVLYAILAGKPPYYGMKAREFLAKVSDFPPKPVREIEPNAPPELAAVCEKALERDADKRYQNAQELREDVEKYLSGGLVSAYEYRLSELLKRYVKKHAKILGTAAAGLVAVIIAVAVGYHQVLQQRDVAEFQRDRAVEAEKDAVKERDRAVVAEADAVEQRDKAERELYFANDMLSQAASDEYKMDIARDKLLQAAGYTLDETANKFVPPEAQSPNLNWEWGYLMAQANPDLMALRRGGRYAAFMPDGDVITGRNYGAIERSSRETGDLEKAYVKDKSWTYALAFNADNTRLAFSGERFVAVYDAASGEELLHFDEPDRALTRNIVAMSADGRMAGALNTDKQARIWETGKAEPILTVPVRNGNGFNIALGPRGEKVLIATQDLGTEGMTTFFEVLTLPSGESLGKVELPEAAVSIYSAVFSPDGERLALATAAGIILWNAAAWKQEQVFPGKYGLPGTVAFGPQGVYIAGGDREGQVGLWRVSDGQGAVVNNAHEDMVRSIAFSHGGTRFATASADHTANYWAIDEKDGLPAPRRLRGFRGHTGAVFSVAFSPDDLELATGSFDGTTRIWDLSAEVEHLPIKHLRYAKKAGLLAASMGNTAAAWDVHNGHRVQTFAGAPGKITAVAISDNGARVAACSGINEEPRTLQIWDAANGKPIASIENVDQSQLEFLDGGAYLLALDAPTVTVYNAQDGAQVWQSGGILASAAVSDDGAFFACTRKTDDAGQRTVAVWRADAPEPVLSFPEESAQKSVSCLAFAPDSSALFVVPTLQDDQNRSYFQVRRVALDSGTVTAEFTLEGEDVRPTTVHVDQKGEAVAVGTHNGKIALLDAVTLEQRHYITKGHSSNIAHITFSSGGSRMATASHDLTFKLWDVDEGREILTLQDSSRMAAGNLPLPEWTVFSPDGRQLITLATTGKGVVVPPIVLHAFSWDLEAYPQADTIEKRVEAFKRAYWRSE